MSSEHEPDDYQGAQRSGGHQEPVLQLDDITMEFGANRVLKGVTFALRPGRVAALLGANGAGKSTLIKILSGVYRATGGSIRVDGENVTIDSPSRAGESGIQTVHQRIDENVVPGLTVAENLVFEEIVRNEIPRLRSTARLLPRARDIASTLDLEWPDSKLLRDVYELGIADRQLLLLARALIKRPRALILDEPTSTLSHSEAERLFAMVRRLRDEGVAILYVSHHLSEIRSLADELVVLRDGRIVDRQEKPLDLRRAIESMLGAGGMVDHAPVAENRGGDVAVSLRGVQLLQRSEPIELDLHYEEVTGIVGLIGAGKSELARGIYGVDRFRAGAIFLDGQPFRPRHSAEAVRRGIYMVSEDRAAHAMLPGWSVGRTGSLPFLGMISRSGLIDSRSERREATRLIQDFGVVCTGPDQPVDALSGGNQQKVVVGRWMMRHAKVLLLDEPFRGVDIGARRDLSKKARDCARQGACVVVLSSDVDEIREVADRIVVMVEGRVTMSAYSSDVEHSQIVKSMTEVA